LNFIRDELTQADVPVHKRIAVGGPNAEPNLRDMNMQEIPYAMENMHLAQQTSVVDAIFRQPDEALGDRGLIVNLEIFDVPPMEHWSWHTLTEATREQFTNIDPLYNTYFDGYYVAIDANNRFKIA
jgi:hypothetical protein